MLKRVESTLLLTAFVCINLNFLCIVCLDSVYVLMPFVIIINMVIVVVVVVVVVVVISVGIIIGLFMMNDQSLVPTNFYCSFLNCHGFSLVKK